MKSHQSPVPKSGSNWGLTSSRVLGYEEVFYVLDGEMEFLVGDNWTLTVYNDNRRDLEARWRVLSRPTSEEPSVHWPPGARSQRELDQVRSSL